MAVKTHHAGLTGTLTRGDNQLIGTVLSVDGAWGGDMFSFEIKGSRNTNKFFKSEWDFTPDPTRIPEALGLYAKMVDDEPVLFFRLASRNDAHPSMMIPGSGDGWQVYRRILLEEKLGTDGEIVEIEVND